MKNILLFAGSNSHYSINHSLVKAVAALMPGREASVIRLADYPLPMYAAQEEMKGMPGSVLTLKKLISAYECLVVSVAEHNGSLPAFFKNTLDWLSRAGDSYRLFEGKRILLLSASPGMGGSGALAHTQSIFSRLGATITGIVPVTNVHQKLAVEEGQATITNEALKEEVLHAITQL